MNFDFSEMENLPSSWSETVGFSCPKKPSKWNELHRDVIHGVLTPQQAEEQDGFAGYKFSIVPSFPCQPIVWNVEMAAAWVITRNMAHVLRHHPHTWLTARTWVKNDHIYNRNTGRNLFPFRNREYDRHGHDLVDLKRAPLGTGYYAFTGDWNEPPRVGWDVELREKLFEGRLTAVGLDESFGSMDLPSHYWLEARFVDYGSTTGLATRGTSLANEVLFRGSDLLNSFDGEATLSPIHVRRYHPWRRNIGRDDLTLRQSRLLRVLKMLYPLGFPDFASNRIRYQAMTIELERFGLNHWQDSRPSFDRYMSEFRPIVSGKATIPG